MISNCTAREYLEGGYMATSIMQTDIVVRAAGYGCGSSVWMGFGEPIHAKDHARMAATLAFLAFPDLRVDRVEEEVAA